MSTVNATTVNATTVTSNIVEASTIDTTNITDGISSITFDNLYKGVAKAWVNFNGTGTVAIRASFNVTSITDNAVGDYTVNFTNALPDVNYSAAITAGGLAAHASVARFLDDATARTTSLIRITIFSSTSGGSADVPQVNISVFR